MALIFSFLFFLPQHFEFRHSIFKLRLARLKLNLKVMVCTCLARYLIMTSLNFFLLVHETMCKLTIGVLEFSYLRISKLLKHVGSLTTYQVLSSYLLVLWEQFLVVGENLARCCVRISLIWIVDLALVSCVLRGRYHLIGLIDAAHINFWGFRE